MRDQDQLILEQLYTEMSNDISRIAESRGYNIGPVYHSSPSTFTIFDSIEGGYHFGTKEAALEVLKFHPVINYEIDEYDGRFYVIPDNGDNEGEEIGVFESREDAEKFIKTQPKRLPIYEVYLKIDRVKRVEDAGTAKGWEYEIKRAMGEGYDGLIYTNEVEDRGSDSYVVFNPTQIKLADPITYDDEGNPIPLEKRFDSNNPDIRY